MKPSKGRFAGTVRVGEKGQIVIPKGARDLLGIQPGDTLLVLADEKRGLAIPPRADSQRIMSQIIEALEQEGE